ncbi:hypothetical protein [Butyrivibrio fibrisolvens]|nr:hypothetical protein [Butyrivibrio fibrisolvens]
MEIFEESEDWGINDKGALFLGAEENVTTQEEAAKHISNILGEIGAKNG